MLIFAVISFTAILLYVALVGLAREGRASAEARKRAWTTYVEPVITALKEAGVPWTTVPDVLAFEVSGIARSTPLIHAARDAAGLRFVTSFGCHAVHSSGPTGWGDWHETHLTFHATSCPKCHGKEITLYAFRAYSDLVSDRGDCQSSSYGPRPISTICLRCHATQGTEDMSKDDVAFVHRCQEIVKRASAEKLQIVGPYR